MSHWYAQGKEKIPLPEMLKTPKVFTFGVLSSSKTAQIS
ncbi:hypothetical protein FTV88_1800 [Heliorestis convoluta]|uniref:Uncharacterized protein n=1 Tax=Heliorestis convoluta TaxID=356322 RepID=A0A5Q2MYT2_9FIRM|nr:hypothetical protein FTV88_1800 [Heliorestis convoluta]